MNNAFPSKDELTRLREQYPPGTWLELLAPLEDPYARQKPSDRATVKAVDDAGNLICLWDSGSTLNILPGIDRFRKIPEEPIIPDNPDNPDNPVNPVITDTIMEQILAIRAGGNAPNMFDTVTVQRQAFNRNFFELVLLIEENRDAYARFILTGDRG